MKDKATLLFLTAIAYAAVAACLFQLTPLASPVARVSLQDPGNPVPAIAPTTATRTTGQPGPRLPDRHGSAMAAGAPAVF